jgi:hypothetical protein
LAATEWFEPYLGEKLAAFLRHLAAAGIVAGLLGITVEIWLRRELRDDALKAALGYGLPREIKNEFLRIFDCRFCGTVDVWIEIKSQGDDFVRCDVTIDREIENITSGTQSLQLELGIDDWGRGEPSKIYELAYDVDSTGEKKVDVGLIKKRPFGLHLTGPELKIRPEGKVRIRSRYSETRHRSDEISLQFSSGIINPKIRMVSPPEGVSWTVHFPHSNPAQSDGLYGKYLVGALLPHQPMKVIWWDEKALGANEKTV